MTPPSEPAGTIRYLWVLRHGKAARNAPAGGGDKERPLTARGRRDATALGHRLAAGVGVFGLRGVPVPEVALCSSAVRTRQTADLVLEAMGGDVRLEALHSLYGANPDTVLGYVRELDDGFTSALLVGHNRQMAPRRREAKVADLAKFSGARPLPADFALGPAE